MGFLATVVCAALVFLNQSWLETVDFQFNFWRLMVEYLVIVLFCASVSAVAFEWAFHIHWKRTKHSAHHHVGLLLVGPLVSTVGFFMFPQGAFLACLMGLALEIIMLFMVRTDLIVDGLFSGLFMGVLLSVLFSLTFSTIPGSFFAPWQLSGYVLGGVPVEMIAFFFFFGVVWGPWYEVVKDYVSS
jgi:hypothetical protein